MGREKFKMKLSALFSGYAAASSCFDRTSEFDQARCLAKEISGLSSQTVESFEIDWPPAGAPPIECLEYFFQGCFYCAENIQGGHPFCLEDNPNYNPIMCTIIINKCLMEQLEGVMPCLNGGGVPERP